MCIWQGTMCSCRCNLSHQILSPMNRETLNNFQCVDFAITIFRQSLKTKKQIFLAPNQRLWKSPVYYKCNVSHQFPSPLSRETLNNFQWVASVITLLDTVRQKWSKHWNQALNSAQALKSVKNSAHLWVLEAFCERRVAFVVAAGFQRVGAGELINK